MFFEQEAAERMELHYPPFGHLVEVEIRGAKKETRHSGGGHDPGRPCALAHQLDVELLGPAPKPIARIQGAERWHILIRSGSRKRSKLFEGRGSSPSAPEPGRCVESAWM